METCMPLLFFYHTYLVTYRILSDTDASYSKGDVPHVKCTADRRITFRIFRKLNSRTTKKEMELVL